MHYRVISLNPRTYARGSSLEDKITETLLRFPPGSRLTAVLQNPYSTELQVIIEVHPTYAPSVPEQLLDEQTRLRDALLAVASTDLVTATRADFTQAIELARRTLEPPEV